MKNNNQYKYKERHQFKKVFGFDAPMDKLSLILGKFCIDIFVLEEKIPEYDTEECTYKGKSEYSIAMAIEEEYGKEAMELVKSLM